ncbi:SGNH/GDSL hydrolase family protein [Psychrobacillus sp. BL-248-WT-3]|uniref:SGNH/GDSL hydrolase family protein n=1 Tax=Psychrobacillus sp. BL-248-WT-3 TaxID=2725306 RepID=UPI003211CFEF
MKRWISLLMILLILSPVYSVEAKSPEVYIPLGDSLAAGQTPNMAIDAGYTDLISQELKRANLLGFYSKALAFPGYTTSDVLKTVQSTEAKDLLANATLVTISAGANDLLRLVQVKPASGMVAYSQVSANFALNNVRKNMQEIIKEVQATAPKAKIYVMGYYFAYPHVHESQKEGVGKELDKLHTILQTVAEQNGATYISVEESFDGKEKKLVPSVGDVHPTLEGYRQMANSFFSKYNSRMLVYEHELPKPNPLTFEELIENRNQSNNGSTQTQANALPINRYLSFTNGNYIAMVLQRILS